MVYLRYLEVILHYTHINPRAISGQQPSGWYWSLGLIWGAIQILTCILLSDLFITSPWPSVMSISTTSAMSYWYCVSIYHDIKLRTCAKNWRLLICPYRHKNLYWISCRYRQYRQCCNDIGSTSTIQSWKSQSLKMNTGYQVDIVNIEHTVTILYRCRSYLSNSSWILPDVHELLIQTTYR